jgi:hypothetical protein
LTKITSKKIDMANIPDELMEQYKKQWEALGLDPNTMMQYMNNSMEMATNMQNQMADMLKGQFKPIDGSEPDDDFDFSLENKPQIKKDADISDEAILKAIACGGNLAFVNSMYLNTLGSYKPISQILEMLESEWEIESKDGLVDIIDWLTTSGHRKYFDLIKDGLKGVPQAEMAGKIEEITNELDGERDFEVIESYAMNTIYGLKLLKGNGFFKTMKQPSILAWDLGRAINLCRWGYDVQYFTKEEALTMIQKCATQLYITYDSWRSLSEGYLLGCFMWSGDEERIEELFEEHTILLEHADSPWVNIAW